MERHEIDAAVVSVGPPASVHRRGGRPSELAGSANDGIAEVVRAEPAALRRAGDAAAA